MSILCMLLEGFVLMIMSGSTAFSSSLGESQEVNTKTEEIFMGEQGRVFRVLETLAGSRPANTQRN